MSRREPEWTDANPHDPSVTLLETLLYTLADLGDQAVEAVRTRRCGWKCLMLLSAGAAGAVVVARRRRASG